MAKLPILQEPNDILREKASEVSLESLASGRIQKLLRDMHDTLVATDIGVGLAAPQISRSLRIFLVLEEVVKKKQEELSKESKELKKKERKTLVFVNPTIIKASGKKVWMVEGCLSVDGIFGKIRRSEKVTIEAHDEHGKKISRGASGIFAEIIQHEMDHLDGVLFIDNAKEVRKVKAEEK